MAHKANQTAILNGKANGKGTSKKRKEVQSDSEDELGLSVDMASDDETKDSGSGSDGEAEPFPEIDPASSSEEEYSDEPDYEEDESDSDSMSMPPGGKVVTSGITGHPKRVYNPIDPNYDSDSSTEDVSICLHFRPLAQLRATGSKSYRQCPRALV